MIGAFVARGSSVGIFWMVETGRREARLLTAGCLLESAEPYGDFLTFPDGHYEVWGRWRNSKGTDPAMRAVVRAFEYEDWPRGRIVFERLKKRFLLYADRKLMLPGSIARIQKRFAISPDRTTVETDFHYQSTETPGSLP
jgi:hypothetical protein